jgi:hypothetical protein
MQFTIKDVVPVGSYPAQLQAIESKDHAEYGAGVAFKFCITSGPQAGQVLFHICSTESPPSMANKLGRTLAGLLGRTLRPGEVVTVEQFVGGHYWIVVEAQPKGEGTRITAVINKAEPSYP